MKRKWLGAACAVGFGVSAVASGPAEAASYNIKGSYLGVYGAYDAFKARGCDPALANPVEQGGLTGTDSVIVNVTGRTVINARWSATVQHAAVLSGLFARFLNAACTDVTVNGSIQSRNPGAWSFNVPAGTKWLIVTAERTADVTLTL